MLDTGEELLAAALGVASPLTRAAQSIDPFIVPYDQLARVEGWVVWLGHPPVPDGLGLLPVPDHLLWDEPATTLATVAAVAADYAARRGCRNAEAMRETLARESPVAVVLPGEIVGGLRPAVQEVAALGVPVLDRPSDVANSLRSLDAFAMRQRAHAAPVGRPHDPAMSFQQIVPIGRAGGDAVSSFIVHDRGRHDGVSASGETGEHLGIEIGVGVTALSLPEMEALERRAAVIPSFLGGVTSAIVNDSLEIGWRAEAQPSGQDLGEVFRVWLKELEGFDQIEVRVVFAPAGRRSSPLAQLNARADEIRREREEAFASAQSSGEPVAPSPDSFDV